MDGFETHNGRLGGLLMHQVWCGEEDPVDSNRDGGLLLSQVELRKRTEGPDWVS